MTTGDCERCGKPTPDGIVVKGEAAGIYKVLARVAGIETDQAIEITADLLIAELDEASAVVESGATVEVVFWICGDCAGKTGYKVGPMGTVEYREGVEGMGEVL